MKWLIHQSLGWSALRWHDWLKRLFFCVALVILVTQSMATPASATGAYEVPKPDTGVWVVDRAEVLSRSNESKINNALEALATGTGNEVHIVSIHRLDYEETAETFVNQLFEKWFPTPEAQANQVLLVIDNLTNDTAIRTGEKVKTLLPDAIARSVVQETVLIPLKQGNKYNQALLEAADRLIAVLSGKPDPGPPEVKDTISVDGTFATPEETQSSNATVWVIGFLIVATVVPMATYYFYLYLQSR